MPRLPEEISGVEVALAPRLLCGLGELPVVEAGAEAARDGLVFLRAIVVAETEVGEAQSIGEEPAFVGVLGKEGFDAAIAITAAVPNFLLEVVEGDEREDSIAKLRILVLVDAPETLGIRCLGLWLRPIAICQQSAGIARTQLGVGHRQRLYDCHRAQTLMRCYCPLTSPRLAICECSLDPHPCRGKDLRWKAKA